MKRTLYQKFFGALAKCFFPKAETVYHGEDTDEPAVYLCNHSAAIGPALMTLYFEKPHRTWMIGYVFDKKKNANYFAHDGFFLRARKCKWFWRVLSKITVTLLRPLLFAGNPILVHHDRRIIETLRESLDALVNEKTSLVIFPESPKRFSPYVSTIYDGFADIGRMYYNETGKCLKFFPVYAEKHNRVISVGDPIVYDPTLQAKEQRRIIADYIRDNIDALARALPEHEPTPFLPDLWYEYYGEYETNVAEYWKLFE